MGEGNNSIPLPDPTQPGPMEYAEVGTFATGHWRTHHAFLRSLRDLRLSYILFAFVLVINILWEFFVIRWVSLSGKRDSWFHLNDSVLIALATTSVANFIGLVAIVAKHLFPEMKAQEASK